MLDVSSQTADDPFYQRIVYLVKALVRTAHLLQPKFLRLPVLGIAASGWQDRIAWHGGKPSPALVSAILKGLALIAGKHGASADHARAKAGR